MLNRDVEEILYDENGKFRGIKSKGEEAYGKILISFTFSVNFDIGLSMISLIKMTEILLLLEGGTFFVSLCSTFGICHFLSFLKLVIISMFNTLLYFRPIKIYFDWICYANLSLK